MTHPRDIAQDALGGIAYGLDLFPESVQPKWREQIDLRVNVLRKVVSDMPLAEGDEMTALRKRVELLESTIRLVMTDISADATTVEQDARIEGLPINAATLSESLRKYVSELDLALTQEPGR